MQTNPANKPIILVGGGTGGHIMPLIAVGEELQLKKRAFIYVGGKNSREEKLVTDLGWSFMAIDSGKWRRDPSLSGLGRNIADLGLVVKGIFQSLKILSTTNAETVFSKGGHVALPMVIAAKLAGKKIIIHESDSVMGWANRFSARFATVVLTAFDPSVFSFADSRFMRAGIPIRKSLRQAASLKAPAKTRPVIMIIGGIQGALAINNYIRQILPQLVKKYDVVHSTGEHSIAAMKEVRQALPKADQAHYKPFANFERELPYYYQTADLVISRASATVIVEAALFSKAMYVIPLPNSAGNHQVMNAKMLQKAGAVVGKEQYQLTSEVLLADIEQLMADTDKRRELGQTLHSYFDTGKTLERIMEVLNG